MARDAFINFEAVEDWFAEKVLPLYKEWEGSDVLLTAARDKVIEEMGEWLKDKNEDEAIDVIVCLYVWMKLRFTVPQEVLDRKLAVLMQSEQFIQPDGTWHRVVRN